MPDKQQSRNDRAGGRPRNIWRIRPWCREVPLSPTKYYELPDSQRPRTIQLAGVPYIVEPPQAWRDRLVAEQSGTVEAADVVG